ncbi:CZB domain-containing protein [Acidiferrobacter sp.]|uniref:CZB domain-containing protein n=1 Tax=Acidiferrobacter sp. TaxID=1872107 RepID=UPI0026067907|nr:CZB domain-containing protein [Acidiferrobacter sp.]
MGLLGSFAEFFGFSDTASHQKALIRQEINIMDAINAHVQWKIRLQDFLDGKTQEALDPMVIGRDDRCVLGQWIHGPALRHFHENPTFQKLRADHAQFHLFAANVVKLTQDNDRSAARALLDGDYQRISHKVVHALTDLKQAVGE